MSGSRKDKSRQPPPSLEELLQAARAGAPEALGRLLEHYRPYLRVVAQAELLPDLQPKADPSDLVQETLFKAQRGFADFAGQSTDELRAWLRRILVNNVANLVRDYVRTGKRGIHKELMLSDLSASRLLEECLAADSTSPSGKVSKEEQEQALKRALEELPAHYRMVLALRHRDNLAFEDIGRKLKRSPDAARMVYDRALKQVQKLLGSSP